MLGLRFYEFCDLGFRVYGLSNGFNDLGFRVSVSGSLLALLQVSDLSVGGIPRR